MKRFRVLCVAGGLSVFVSGCSSGSTGGQGASSDAADHSTMQGAPPPDGSDGTVAVDARMDIEGAPPPDGSAGSVDSGTAFEGAPPPDGNESSVTVDGGTRVDGSAGEGSDAAGDAADASNPCAKSLFCDNFEEYPAGGLPTPTWRASQNGGTLRVDTTRAHSGTQSVQMSAAASTGYRSILISLSKAGVVPIASNHLFGRMAFYLDSSPTTSVHWTFIDGFGATSAGYHALYRYGGQTPAANGNTLMANYDTPDSYGGAPVGPSSDCWLHSKTVVPTAAWSCAEWEFDGPNNTMRFWLDGTAITDLTMTGTGQGCVHQPSPFTWLAPTFSRIDLGWESYQADAARTLWIDDVAIGEVRLGCAP
jgi:hypothetical protein